MVAKKKANKGDYKGNFIDCPLCRAKQSFSFKKLIPNRLVIRHLEEQQCANASATTANVASRSETASDSTAGHREGRQPHPNADPKITPRGPKRPPTTADPKITPPDRFEPPAFPGVTAEQVSTRTRDASKSSTGEPHNDQFNHDKTSASPTIGREIVSRVIPGSIVEVVSCRSTSRDIISGNHTSSDPTVTAADEAATNDGEPIAEERAISNGESSDATVAAADDEPTAEETATSNGESSDHQPEISSTLSENGDEPTRRVTGRSTEDQSFFKDLYATVIVEPASDCVEEKVYTDVDLENIEDMFYGKGRDDDFKNVEQDKKLFQRVNKCFGRVEDKSMDILDSAQMANEKFQAGL
jgi:hypothetical protein